MRIILALLLMLTAANAQSQYPAKNIVGNPTNAKAPAVGNKVVAPLVLDADGLSCPTCSVATGEALTSFNDANVTLTLGGTPTSALINATSMTMGWNGVLSVVRGGTGTNASTGAGSVVLNTSPTFAGVPIAPTAGIGTNTSQIATTAFVYNSGVPIVPLDFTSDGIQNALDRAYAMGGGVVSVEKCGTYLLNSTLIMRAKTTLIGNNLGCTIFQRVGDYGDTLKVGSASVGSAQGVTIKNIWFLNPAGQNWTGQPVHLRLYNAQSANIDNCWFWGAYGQILIEGGAVINISKSNFAPSGPLGNFSIKYVLGDTGGIPTSITMDQVYMAAGGYTYGIYGESVEVASLQNSYVGGYASANIYVNPVTIHSGMSIANNFLDPSLGDTIRMENTHNQYAISTTITGNQFYGAYGSGHHIVIGRNGAMAAAQEVIINGNTLRDSVKASMRIEGAIGFMIEGNTLLNYNQARSDAGPNDYAGIYILGGGVVGVTRNGNVNNNMFGYNGLTAWGPSNDPDNYAIVGILTQGGVTNDQINMAGNEGTMRDGGSLLSGDILWQKTLIASNDNSVPRTAGAHGNLKTSGVFIDDQNNIAFAGGYFGGTTSGAAYLKAQSVAGTPTLSLPTVSGTLPSTATTPLALNATTGALSLGIIPTYLGGLGVNASSSNGFVVYSGGAASFVAGTGSGNVVRSTSPTITTPLGIVKADVGLGNVDNTSDVTKNAAVAMLTNKTLVAPIITGASGVPIPGTNTNNNAAAGYVGEYIESIVTSGSPFALTSTTAANMTSISLTAGDWDVMATLHYIGDAATNVAFAQASVNTSSATLNVNNQTDFYTNSTYFSTFNGGGFGLASGTQRISLSTTANVYAVARSVFTAGNLNVYGTLRARRAR